MLRKLSVGAAPVNERAVLVRADLNAPAGDDTRIRESVPTLQYLLARRSRVVVLSHSYQSLKPVGERLAELLRRPVPVLEDCVGPGVRGAVSAMAPGEIVLLENLRNHPGEEQNDAGFAAELAALGEIYVNDGFGVAHRLHASVDALPRKFARAYAGLLMEKEIRELSRFLGDPEPPVVALLGGSKLSDKLGAIQTLRPKLSALLVGGAMAYPLLQSTGTAVGDFKLKQDQLDASKKILHDSGALKIVLPRDHRIVRSIDDPSTLRDHAGPIPAGWSGVDIGPETLQEFAAELGRARTILWFGPLGIFETEPYAQGTLDVARMLGHLRAVTVVGGGETGMAVNRAGVRGRLTHVSTGGGAALRFLADKGHIPGVDSLTDA